MKKSTWYMLITFGLVLLLLWVVCAVQDATAENYGTSIEDKGGFLTFQHEVALDSAHAIFGYPDNTNWYDTTKLLPALTLSDDSTVVGAAIDLDSIGIHPVRIIYFEKAAADTSGIDFGTCLNDYSVQFHGLLAGYMPGAKSIEDEQTNIDTLWLYGADGTTKIGYMALYHTGGPAGGNPDSTKSFTAP